MTLLSIRNAIVAASMLASALACAADDFDAYIADIGILQLKTVQTELKITETQRANMNKHAAWLDSQGAAINAQVKAKQLTPEQANKKMEGYLVTLKTKVIGELTAAQLKRLREITLQRDGLLPLMDEKVGAKMGLTKAQQTTLRDAFVENDKKAKQTQSDAFKPIFDKYNKMTPKSDDEKKKLTDQMNKELEAARQKILPQLEALGKSFADLVDKTLTKGQKDAFTALKGKPFDPKGTSG